MKLRHPWIIRSLAFLVSIVLRIWLRTLSYRVASRDLRQHPTDPETDRNIYAFWHESLLAPAKAKTNVRVLISRHADGEFIAGVCRHLGIGVVRGSTTRGGGRALMQLLRNGRDAHLAITPDGPRGPRRRVQLGIVFLASATGLPIVPVGVGFSRAWRAGSWDRFAVPRPWSTITGVLGPTIHVPANLSRDGLERYRTRLQQRMLEATRLAEQWAEHPRRPPVELEQSVRVSPQRLRRSA